MMKRMLKTLAIAGAMFASTTAQAATTDFSSGDEGWIGNGAVDTTLGHSAPGFTTILETRWTSWRNISNPNFIGDYTTSKSVTISLDTLTQIVNFDGMDVSRDLWVKLTDFGDTAADEMAYASVYFNLGTLLEDGQGWKHFSVTIDDTSSTALPEGWVGVDVDGNLNLPDGYTFADLMANVDQIDFTSAAPGYLHGMTVFWVTGDNFTVTRGTAAVPEPATWAMMIAGFGVVGSAIRRRRRTALV